MLNDPNIAKILLKAKYLKLKINQKCFKKMINYGGFIRKNMKNLQRKTYKNQCENR